MTLSPQTHDDELAWLAFRYVAGELAPEESTAFEHVLDQDQRTREAVAEAVALMAGVVQVAPALRTSAKPKPNAKRWLSPRTRRTAAVAVALASAACLALAVTARLIDFKTHHNPTDAGAGAATPGLGSAVALAWLGLFDEAAQAPRPDDTMSPLDTVSSLDTIGALDDPEADTMTSVETAVADSGERIEGLPAWLIEAASLHPSS